jgi:hypothetical protein
VLAAFIIALMMDAANTTETSVNFYQTTRRNHPKDGHLQDGDTPTSDVFIFFASLRLP